MVNINAVNVPGRNFVDNITTANQSTMGGCVDARSYTTNSVTATNAMLGTTLPNSGVIEMDISDDPPSTTVAGTFFKGLIASNNDDCPDAKLRRMTLLKSEVIDTVKSMGTDGYTEVQIGLAWGWRMLSPNWRGLWGSSPTYTYPDTTNTISLPLPYSTAKMQKVVILMTDGKNTVANPHSSNNAYFSQTTYPDTTAKINTQTKNLCDAMKSQGIVIYVIGFGPDSGVDYSLLKYCSSTPTLNCGSAGAYCFKAATNVALANAFQQIGDVLANLRISQ
jgi:hypothetical protein